MLESISLRLFFVSACGVCSRKAFNCVLVPFQSFRGCVQGKALATLCRKGTTEASGSGLRGFACKNARRSRFLVAFVGRGRERKLGVNRAHCTSARALLLLGACILHHAASRETRAASAHAALHTIEPADCDHRFTRWKGAQPSLLAQYKLYIEKASLETAEANKSCFASERL